MDGLKKEIMKYFDTFTGIGGFTKGIQTVIPNAECIGYSEIDKYASAIYNYHYPNHKNYGDITSINVRELPDFDLFVGGFPCQAFSIAGKRQGFKDTRGTLFFDVARILKAKRPEWFLLENVKGLLNHDNGKTISTIFRVLTELGYSVGWEVVNSCHFGVPQNRERIFIVGHLREAGGRAGEVLPFGQKHKITNGLQQKEQGERERFSGEIPQTNGKNGSLEVRGRGSERLSETGEKVISGTWRTHKDGEGFRELENSNISPCIPARAREDGSGQPVIKAVLTPDRLEKRQNGRRFKDNDEPSFTLTSQDKHGVQVGTEIRRLTPKECERLQGFPDDWTAKGVFDAEEKEISDTQRYKTLGNAVTVNVIEAIIRRIISIC